MERSARARSAERAFPALLASRCGPLRCVQIAAQHISASLLWEANSALAVHELSFVVQCMNKEKCGRSLSWHKYKWALWRLYPGRQTCTVDVCVLVLIINITRIDDWISKSHRNIVNTVIKILSLLLGFCF